eukprot:15303735-Ditylum_brightwellii.AAC.1
MSFLKNSIKPLEVITINGDVIFSRRWMITAFDANKGHHGLSNVLLETLKAVVLSCATEDDMQLLSVKVFCTASALLSRLSEVDWAEEDD